MHYSNAIMLKLATETGRKRLFDDTALRALLKGQWGVDLPPEPFDISLAVDEFELAVTYDAERDVCADALMRGRVRVSMPGEGDEGGDEPRDPFSDPSFRADASAADGVLGEYGVQIACLICDEPVDLRAVLYRSKALAAALPAVVAGRQAGGDVVAAPARDGVVALIVPGSVFDDDVWPGSQRVTGSKTRRRELRLEFVNSVLLEEGVFGMLGCASRR